MKRIAAISLLAVMFVLLGAAVQAEETWDVEMFRQPVKRPTRKAAARKPAGAHAWLRRAIAAEDARRPRVRRPVSYGADEVPVLRSRTR